MLLTDKEKEYVNFIHNKEIKMIKSSEEEAFRQTVIPGKIKASIRKIMFSDKDFFVKASKAFVTFIRSYKEHKLTSVFTFEDIEVENTARSFFLIKIPSLTELKGKKYEGILGTEEDLKHLETLEFKNHNQKEMIEKRAEVVKEKNEKFLKKKAYFRKKAEKEKRNKKVRSRAERNRAKMRESDNLDKELKREEKLARLLKKGKISEKEYDKELDKVNKKYEIF